MASLYIPSWDKKHKYRILDRGNFGGECDVLILRIDKKDIFENRIYTCSSCLKQSDETIIMYEQLKLF